MTVFRNSVGLRKSDEIAFIRILDTPISIVSLDRVIGLFDAWMANRQDRCVVLRDVHGIMRARNDVDLRNAHEHADLITPDGMPLVWVSRIAGTHGISRVCGADLLSAVCRHGLEVGWRHYFYGGAPGVAEQVIAQLLRKHPAIQIAGWYFPPFRALNRDEDEFACADIRAKHADFVWVGLGTPKQELWMEDHRGRCGGAIMLGVGAAFNFHSGSTSRAPKWMQNGGLEWLFRLLQEPRRLWRRYLLLAPLFAILVSLDLVRSRIAPQTRDG